MGHDGHPCLGRKLEKLREKERKKEAKRKISSLSFTLEEEEEGGEEEEEMAMYEEELEREGEGTASQSSVLAFGLTFGPAKEEAHSFFSPGHLLGLWSPVSHRGREKRTEAAPWF